MISPDAETNDPDPPLLNRTADERRWSAQPAGGSNPYLALSRASGRLLNTHIPSSPCTISTEVIEITQQGQAQRWTNEVNLMESAPPT